MRKFSGMLFLFVALCLQVPAQDKQLSLNDFFVKGTFRTEGVYGLRSMNDGEHYTVVEGNGARIVKYSYKTGLPVATLLDLSQIEDCPVKYLNDYTFNADESRILLCTNKKAIYRRSFTADYYIYDFKNKEVKPLSGEGRQQLATFSPDGQRIAFVRDNNIFIHDLRFGSERQITFDGEFNHIINGAPDWVYEEEFAFNRALEFSADSKMLAFVRFDEAAVSSYSFPVYAGEAPRIDAYAKYPGAYTYKYPKTGEANSKVSVHTFDIKSKVTRRIDVPLDEDGYIPRIQFTKDPNKLAILTLNRHQNRLDLYFADPRSTVCKLVLRDESDTYIKEGTFDYIRFYPEHFSFASEKSGYNHLYWYNMNGNLQKQVTSGQYEVTGFLGYDEREGAFYYTSREESPMCQAVYKIDRRGKKTKLSTQAGTNSAQFSTDMKYYMNRYTSLNTPVVITLNDNKGKVLTTLVDNQKLKDKMAQYAMPQKEFFSFRTSDGTELNGWMMKPADFSETKKYPVLMYQYSGPGSQEVVDRFSISWETYMASQGYVVACVDGRGTGGRGAAFEKCTYLNLGVKEAHDQVETALYLSSLPYVDKQRIGIWGWSFGGYMTLMSMSEGTPVFRAGVAVAAVTDWNYYDTIYGERFMRTPQENAEGYKAASAMTRADKLHGDLLLVHGMADDNVHFQNCAEYAEHLVQLGKQFDMQVYTNRNHSIFGGNTRLHLYTKLTNFFNSKLK